METSDKKETVMKYKAGFIGAGNMGGALLRAVVNATGKDSIVFYDPDSFKADETQKETGNQKSDRNNRHNNTGYNSARNIQIIKKRIGGLRQQVQV